MNTTKELLMAVSQVTDIEVLRQVSAAVSDRKNALAKLAASSICVGDTVRFGLAIRPTYIAGLTAVVAGKNRESLTVNCPDDPRYGRFQGVRKVRVPLALIAGKVEKTEQAGG